MKVSEQWLREFVNPPVSTRELAERLTLAGIEVTSIADAVPVLDRVVVGEVRAVTKHPQADKLTICQVDVGVGADVQIVCGASNVRADMKAPVMLPGGRLLDGTEIHSSQLRGVESNGMLCSARELGLADDHSGLLELPADIAPGTPLVTVLGGQDKILEVEITANRGDCLSVLGLARELGTLYDLDLRLPDCTPLRAAIKDSLPVQVNAPDACPVFAGRVVRGLRPDAETPLWMRERLRRFGLRTVNPVVDVTQFVMLELGQPMHAYDLARVRSGIEVRFARRGETLQLLDGTQVALTSAELVIADQSGPVGLAGIMGGKSTAVIAGCTDIYLESAYFLPTVIQGEARRLGLATDASYRFERGVDPASQVRALERATRLLQAIAGCQAGPVGLVEPAQHKPPPIELLLRAKRLERLLGISVPGKEVTRSLTRLGFRPKPQAEGWLVQVPSHRFDIEIEEDLVEEVGRIYGYEQIPTLPYPSAQPMLSVPEQYRPLSKLRDLLVGRGYQEAITYSFVDPELQKLLTGDAGIALANPIAAEMAEMRRSLWPGLIQALRYNLNRQQSRVRLFELGVRFILQDNEIKEENVISGLLYGSLFPPQWGLSQRLCDFSDMRGDVETLLAAKLGKRLQIIPGQHPGLHPGQSAHLQLDGQELGWMGKLHPVAAQQLELKQAVFLFELNVAPLLRAPIPMLEPISRFPVIHRDLAVVLPETVSAAQLLDVVRREAGGLLVDLNIFDIYRGKGIDLGRKSIALGLILQDSSRTLTDETADALIAKIVERLRHDLGATIRD